MTLTNLEGQRLFSQIDFPGKPYIKFGNHEVRVQGLGRPVY